MANLYTNVLILFAISALAAFFWPLIRDGVIKELSLKPIVTGLAPFALVLVPFGAMFGLAAYLQQPVNVTLPCFLGAAVLSYVLSRTGLPAPLRGVLLLASAVGFTWCLPTEGILQPIAAAILGLFAAKLTDNLLLAQKPTYDDLIAPVTWLGGALWFWVQSQQTSVPRDASILLGVLSVCLLLRVVQRPFMTDDRWLLKRIILSATGGLGTLLVINKMMLATTEAQLAIVVGVGMFCAYLFQNVDAEGEDKITASVAIQQLIVIGVLALAAARFFGMYGILLLVPAALLPVRGGFAQYAGMFFLSRVLLQGFVQSYNSNVTGINLTHAYTSAALYAGFIVMAILFMLMRELTDRRVRLALFVAAGALIPMGANFYLHAEPTSSLLVAATVAGVMFATLGPALQKNEAGGYGNLLLVPSMMAISGITYGGLIEAGVTANNETRLGIIGGALALAVIAALISWFISRQDSRKKPLVAAE